MDKEWKIQLYIKTCSTLTEGESTVRNLKNRNPPLEHLSVLGKVSSFTSACFAHLTTTAIPIIDISGIGKIFVAGPLSSLLLEKIDGKALGSLEGGLMGILNGYGLSSKKTFYYLENLRNGKLMVIGWEYVRQMKRGNTFISAGDTK